MMFCDHADKFFPYMQVEIVRFPNGSTKDPKNFIEVPPIKGTVPQIISRTMEKLQDMVIEEYVQKVPDRMEANRFMSYPYEVLEEAVVNAFYHRDYMCYEPVQIEIEPDCIKITSFPGIDRSISLDTIEKGERFKSKMYRNRRLGEFLKELDLTEGRSTGIPTIQEGLQRNGSPRATFETDEDRRVLWVTIPIQPDYFESLDSLDSLDSSDTNQNDISSKQDINDKEIQLLELLEQEPTITLVKAAEKLGWKETLVKYYVASLKKKKMLSRNGTSHNGVWVVSKD
jgi:ATP-dependent DNA helicase RecG